ncbi:hypothetical protein J6590_098623 [Homalodisca vitripennis]|nr:hypothetical protein J6590_045278 [Homalodisca vitripennis]KAG8289719.1 hypothetical protein J6590_098623 [Homalodisca vitripennis]
MSNIFEDYKTQFSRHYQSITATPERRLVFHSQGSGRVEACTIGTSLSATGDWFLINVCTGCLLVIAYKLIYFGN